MEQQTDVTKTMEEQKAFSVASLKGRFYESMHGNLLCFLNKHRHNEESGDTETCSQQSEEILSVKILEEHVQGSVRITLSLR